VAVTTRLGARAADVWARATTPEGINDELRPILRMTVPEGLDGAGIDDVRTGEPLGRSWILLFGFLPVDYDDLCVAEVEPGRRFLERSSMLSMRTWQHEREVEPLGEDACEVTDRLTFELRRGLAWVPGVGSLATAIVRRLFAHRHGRLRRRFRS
jgi:hypothetical protein